MADILQGPDTYGLSTSSSPGKTVPGGKSTPGGRGVSFTGGGEADLGSGGPGGTSPTDSSMSTNGGSKGPMESPTDK